MLVPPSAYHFKLHALRSVVVDFKCFPLTDHGMIEWAKRMEAVLGIPLRPGLEWRKSDALFSSRPASALVEVANATTPNTFFRDASGILICLARRLIGNVHG